ncbi:TonB-dependent receptor [uncultured Maricaulis sp.]|uniref:TonB-dependent receptor domain-containing protein n=1 Tax=uncultured Maricaulis sp. TaxID=174710 RepID=UPI0030DB6869
MASTLISGLAVAAPAVAQDDDVVVVTGSRIQRTDTVAPSPITNVSAEQLAVVNTVNTEDFINTLPQVVPAFDSTSNNPGNGTATVSLRGLGTTRTLVLVDGMRFVGSGASQVVDLNNIPTALVESVDIVTGGASAVYGSDAVAGVVNFIMKDDFEGVDIAASQETSLGDLDGEITNLSITMGGNFDDGRGNAVISMGYTNRNAVFQGDRGFSSLTNWDPGPGNAASGFIAGGSSNIPGTRFRGATTSNFGLNTAAVEAFDGDCVGNSCSGFFVNEQGQVRGMRFGNPNDTYNYAPSNYLQLPQERYNISAFATYEVNEHLELYGRGIYANNVVDSQLAPTPAGVTLNVDLADPNIPAALLALMTNDAGTNNGDGTATIRTSRRYEELGTRNSLRDTSSFQLVFGARGDINENWNYDVFANYSRSSISQIQSGNLSVSALQDAVLCHQNAVGCSAPYANIFGGPGSISAEGAAYISRTGAQIDNVELFQTVATVNGALPAFQLPTAEYAPALVLGVEYREASAESIPDSVLGPDVRGFNSSLPVAGVVDVYEFFAEAEVPLITGKAMVESLSLNAAFRTSEYNTVGNTETFAVGLGWQINDQVRLRGNFNRAVRAPNVGDLFSPFTNGFPGAGDPCSGGANGSYGPSTIDATCIAAGVPAGQVGAPFQGNAQMEALFGGNVNLGVETADTYTIGAVIEPSMIEGLTVQLDYYNIEIEDAISTVPLQTLLNECHQTGIQASCDTLYPVGSTNRNPATGELGANGFTPNLSPVNVATLAVEGIDVRVDYSFGADVIGLPGDMAITYYGGYMIASDYTTSATSPVIECAGLYGLDCGEPTPEYKHSMQTSWYTGPFTTSLRWRHIGALDADPTTLAFVSDLSDDITAKNYFDITFNYDVNETFTATVGVTNFTDTDVPELGSTASEQANTWPATYETLGRRLFVGGRLRF